jgi:uncharacterized protein YqjF (DUF2071 family)
VTTLARPAPGRVDRGAELPTEPITHGPTRRVERAVMLQHWNDITWLHWSYDPDVVQAALPSGIRLDTHDDRAWVGLVPFRMTRLRLPGLPPVPWLTTFSEINVRTYVVAPDGRRAVWFFSLDAPRAPAIALARTAFSLPYCWAGARIERAGDRVTYRSHRRWPRPAASTFVDIEAGESVSADHVTELEHFLTARFGLLTHRQGRTAHGPVDHPAWPLRRATLIDLDDQLVVAAGLPEPSGPPLVHFADGVPVRVGRPEPLHPEGTSR